MSRFLGKVCLLTASTSGIGFATARRLAQEGGKVVICSRRSNNLADALGKLRSEGLQADGIVANVEKEYQAFIDFAVQQHGRIDCLMSNLGISRYMGATLDTPEEVITRTFFANVTASHLLVRSALPHLSAGASVLMLSSIAAIKPMPAIGFYSVSKAALSSLTRVLALELAPRLIRVNAIAAGVIDTKFSTNIADHALTVPMKRTGKPEEIAGPAAFLLSADASYITGETIVVAGGEY